MATILIVEDQAFSRAYMSALLAHAGHLVLEAKDGAQALRVVATSKPDLVISNLLMPNMDGYEFTPQLRCNPTTSNLPVLSHSSICTIGNCRGC